MATIATMNSNPFGKWRCCFIAPKSGNKHDFTLTLEPGSDGPVGRMALLQTKVSGETFSVVFRVHVEICDPFVALLCKDAAESSLGVNAMVLKVGQDSNAMEGQIIWNSGTSHDIQTGTVKWSREC